MLEFTLLTSDFFPAIKHRFASICSSQDSLKDVSLSSQVMYSLSSSVALLLLSFDMTVFTITKTGEFSKTRIRFLTLPFALLILHHVFHLDEFLWNLFVNRFRFSVSLQSPKLSSLLSTCATFDLSVRLLFFLSTVSISFSLILSNSCSLNFPKSVVVVSVVKSLVFKIAVTLGCQPLSRHFRILMFSSSLSNCLPSPIRWLAM